MSRPGGLGNARPADDEVNLIVASVKADLENKAGRTFADLKPVSYATQVGRSSPSLLVQSSDAPVNDS